MPYYFLNSDENPIDENLCMGDTLPTFNTNYTTLDNALATVSAQNISLNTTLKNSYNTLIQSLTSIGASGTTYNSLSTTFRALSSLVLP